MSENTRLFYPARGKQKCVQPNYEYFDRKMRSIRHYRVQYLYDEYRQACEQAGGRPYTLSSFKSGLCAWRKKNIRNQTPEWFPAEYLECYWTYLKISNDSSLPISRYFFVAQLPYSEYTYIRAVESISYRTWMHMCIQAYHFFGGVPYVTECYTGFDSIKTGSKTRSPSSIATLQALAAHYRTVLSRPHPRTNKTAAKRLRPIAPKRHSRHMRYIKANLNISENTSIEEINERINQLVDQINGMSIKGEPSAKETFELYEAPQLLALPAEDYDMSIWTKRTIGANYHFEFDKVHYSVPYTYAHETVRVRVGEDFIEAYHMGSLIARHAILDKKEGRCVCTNPSHRPPKHKVYADRHADRFMDLALEIGPATGAIMKETLAICEKEGVYRRCKDLIDLRNAPSGISLEEACLLTLERDMVLSVESVMQILQENAR